MEKNDGAFVQLADNVYVDINSGTSTSYYESALRFRHGSVTRFAIEKDNVANADLYIRYYNSSGVLQGSPLKIAGDTGAMTLTTALGLTGGLALTLGIELPPEFSASIIAVIATVFGLGTAVETGLRTR